METHPSNPVLLAELGSHSHTAFYFPVTTFFWTLNNLFLYFSYFINEGLSLASFYFGNIEVYEAQKERLWIFN
jgi:hypothetical protein